MEAQQRSVIESQLTQLNYSSVYFLDHGKFEDLISLFTLDAVFDRAGTVHHGHDEIRQGMAERPPITTRHLLANMYYPEIAEDGAAGVITSLTFHGASSANSAPVAYATQNGRVIDFHDTYARIDGVWKIASRQARVVFTPSDWPGNLHPADPPR